MESEANVFDGILLSTTKSSIDGMFIAAGIVDISFSRGPPRQMAEDESDAIVEGMFAKQRACQEEL